MTTRARIEQLESQMLCPEATLSRNTRGRLHPLDPCDLRTEFQRDRDRILHCKAFRRLKHKTQMLLSPTGDHYRTRLTHTMEVSQIARTIARALALNEDLIEAIALGHDLGHTPFGHSGERTMDAWLPGGFEHARQSLRVVDLLENDGAGLNLCYEVRDGILNHSGGGLPQTPEGCVVNLSDRIAYINHDIDDAVRCGILQAQDLPEDCLAVLGRTHGQRIDTMIRDVINASTTLPRIQQSSTVGQAMDALRQFLFARVYCITIDEFEERKTAHVMNHLLAYYLTHEQELPAAHQGRNGGSREPSPASEAGLHQPIIPTDNSSLHQAPPANNLHQRVCDHVAGMTDGYALSDFERLFLPMPLH